MCIRDSHTVERLGLLLALVVLVHVEGIGHDVSIQEPIDSDKDGNSLTPVSYTHLDVYKRQPAHNPKVQFNEEVCPIGSACLAHCAVRWLEDHQ